MSVVPQLERELVAAARHGRLRRPRRVPLLAAVLLVLLAVGGLALAASTLIGTGKPLEPPPGPPLNPHTFLGVPKPGSAKLLKIAVPDPAGGPPWGLRYIETTRGLGCLQVGRVVRGDIGVLGQDGVFNDDGRFHRLSENFLGGIVGPYPCGSLDANGHAFAGIYMRGVMASALIEPTRTQPGCLIERRFWRSRTRPAPPLCPIRDARAITVGMAGPQAESVTYRDGARLRTVPTVGDQGAYLIVQRGPARGRHAFGSFEPLPAPGGGAIVRIDYRNGQVCRIRARLSIRRVCPLVGYAPAGPRLTHADVATPVSARLDVGPHGGRSVVVSFVARAAVTNASAAYQIELRLAGPERNCRGREVGPLLRDVRAGGRMHVRLSTNGCHGVFTGSISYVSGIGASYPPIANGHQLSVGRFTVDAR